VHVASRARATGAPDNYDHAFKGPITLTQALAESRNIPAVALSEMVGARERARHRRAVRHRGDLALGAGAGAGRLRIDAADMTGAYAGILNGGSAVTPYGLLDLTLQGEEGPSWAWAAASASG
jgi:membrane peptidoglycan carboxypeptidase